MMQKAGKFIKSKKTSYRSIIYVDFYLIIRRKYRIVPIFSFFILNRLGNLWT
jgi:hypothetical protein